MKGHVEKWLKVGQNLIYYTRNHEIIISKFMDTIWELLLIWKCKNIKSFIKFLIRYIIDYCL